MKSSRNWISIHAPREGGDSGPVCFPKIFIISIHAPREGGDVPWNKYEIGYA